MSGSLTAVCTLLTMATGGYVAAAVVPPQADFAGVPWKDLAGGGATLLMLAAFVVFLRFLSSDRAASESQRAADRLHVEKLVAECSAMQRETTRTFAETTQNILREVQRKDRGE